VPALDLAVRLRVIGRSPDVRHARNADELLEVLGGFISVCCENMGVPRNAK